MYIRICVMYLLVSISFSYRLNPNDVSPLEIPQVNQLIIVFAAKTSASELISKIHPTYQKANLTTFEYRAVISMLRSRATFQYNLLTNQCVCKIQYRNFPTGFVYICVYVVLLRRIILFTQLVDVIPYVIRCGEIFVTAIRMAQVQKGTTRNACLCRQQQNIFNGST